MTYALTYLHCRTCRGIRWLPRYQPPACPDCGDCLTPTVLTITVGEQLAPPGGWQLAFPEPEPDG